MNRHLTALKVVPERIVVVEVVKPFGNQYMKTFGKPEEVVVRFDFSVVRAYLIDNNSSQLQAYVDERFDEDTAAKHLVITHINCPVAVAQRVAKYAKKGYSIGIRELIKLFVEWQNRPPEYRNRLLELLRRELSEEEFTELERLLRID